MNDKSSIFARCTLALALGLVPVFGFAQESGGATTTEGTTTEGTAEGTSESESTATGAEFSTGQVVADGAGSTYTREKFTAWDMRCVRTTAGAQTDKDPCQLYQLLKDQQGNPVAEISVFGLPESQRQGDAVAGATIITPLETLLTQQVTLAVDGGNAKRYPFTWCSTIGCYARVGFTEAEIGQFRAGATAQVTIVPVTAPDQRVTLSISLSGFTAGYTAVNDANAAIDAASTEN